MAHIWGFLSDAGLEPLQGQYPRVRFRLDRAVGSGANLVITAPVSAQIDDATGAMSVDVVPTLSMIPAATYTVTADWGAGRELDVLTGLRVPEGGGSFADLIAASTVTRFGSDYVHIGPDEPEDKTRWLWWIDTSVTPPALKEWSS